MNGRALADLLVWPAETKVRSCGYPAAAVAPHARWIGHSSCKPFTPEAHPQGRVLDSR
jgi:hypothetical protein